MLGQCRLFLLKRSYSSRNNFHVLEQSVLGRSTLVQRLNKIFLLRTNGNNNIPFAFFHQTAVQKGFCENKLRGIDKEKLSEHQLKIIKRKLRLLHFMFTTLQLVLFFYLLIPFWDERGKVEEQYASYLSSGSSSVPFDETIEKLLKSGKVTQIIRFPRFGKAVAVLNKSFYGVTVGKEVAVLNLENCPFFQRRFSYKFVQEIRRVEKQIGIEQSNEVPIKTPGEEEFYKLVAVLVGLVFVERLAYYAIIRKAKSLIRGKLKV